MTVKSTGEIGKEDEYLTNAVIAFFWTFCWYVKNPLQVFHS